MSADIPFEIQEEIIKRVVPVKSLIQFRSVSKQWKSLIDSSEFITRHSLHPAKPHHLLLRDDAVCNVWMMSKSDVPKSSFTKLFTVKAPNSFSIIGFRKNGQLIIDQMRFHMHDRELEVYEPELKHKNGLGIYGSGFSMASYTESLLLLNHHDSIIQ
ncbi:putative F-box domain-containing protein [Helianthus debilis subsp. tardiflorus]